MQGLTLQAQVTYTELGNDCDYKYHSTVDSVLLGR